MDKIILLIMAIFFVIAGIDYIMGCKFGIGEKFKAGIESIGVLVLSMAGIFAISPVLANVLGKIFVPIAEFLNIDASIFPSMFLAIDMGALGISRDLAGNENMYIVSGVIVASTLGATLSFSIPLALGIVDKKYSRDLSRGIIFGVATMPLSAIVAGILIGMNFKDILVNLLPLFVLALVLIVGMVKFEKYIESIFNLLSKGISIVSLVAFVLIGINSILGVEVIKGMAPVNEALGVAGRIGIFLAGAYPFLEIVTRYCGKYFSRLSKKLLMREEAIINIFASMISNIIIFKKFDKLGQKGRIVCSAFSVSGAFVLGGQLGFVSAQTPEYTTIYIISKLIAGVSAAILAFYMCGKDATINNDKNEYKYKTNLDEVKVISK